MEREKPLVIMFLLNILIVYLFCFINSVPVFSTGQAFSLSLVPFLDKQTISQGAEGAGQEARGRSRQCLVPRIGLIFYFFFI